MDGKDHNLHGSTSKPEDHALFFLRNMQTNKRYKNLCQPYYAKIMLTKEHYRTKQQLIGVTHKSEISGVLSR